MDDLKTEGTAAYLSFNRSEWAALRANTPMTLSARDLAILRSVNEEVSQEEVVEAYLPLSRLLNLHVAAARNLASVKDAFLGRPAVRPPYVIAVAGSVAVGKSTFARILRTLIARWPDRPKVELITTDGFLFPNAVLNERGLMTRKGFPESYDMRRMIRFLADIKSGEPDVAAPLYSHEAYDIVPGESQVIRQPDVLIFEGLIDGKFWAETRPLGDLYFAYPPGSEWRAGPSINLATSPDALYWTWRRWLLPLLSVCTRMASVIPF